jgi:hypothetical protein
MNARQKRFCINAGFLVFTAVFIAVIELSEAGKNVTFAGVLVGAAIGIMTAFLLRLLWRYFIG